MDISALQLAASGNDWSALWPELAVGGLALVLLLLDLACPRRSERLMPNVAMAGLFGLLVAIVVAGRPVAERESFNGLIRFSRAGEAMRFYFVLSAFLVCLLGRIRQSRSAVTATGAPAMPRMEFYHLILVVTAALMLLAQSNHLVMLFVSLETVSIGLYILVSYDRTNPLTLEAGLKYLIMGALSAALLLFGIVLLYGAAGNPLLPAHTSASMHYPDLARFLAANPHNFLASLGIGFVLAGLAFKIGAFPFQIWIPDVYQGAPTPVTALLAVASKAAGFAVLLTLVRSVFPAYHWLVLPVLSGMAGATLLFGNFAALTQHNVKRLLGLSGVSHAGFLLMAVVAAPTAPLAAGAMYFYLFAYLLASFAVFGVMAHVAGADDADQELEHYAGLARRQPFLGLVLAVGLGSLAGIPPLAGFMGKFLVFVSVYQAGLHTLLAIAVAGVVVSIYYYFGWIRAAFFDSAPAAAAVERPSIPVGVVAGLVFGALALASVVLGFYQGPLGHWLTR